MGPGLLLVGPSALTIFTFFKSGLFMGVDLALAIPAPGFPGDDFPEDSDGLLLPPLISASDSWLFPRSRRRAGALAAVVAGEGALIAVGGVDGGTRGSPVDIKAWIQGPWVGDRDWIGFKY